MDSGDNKKHLIGKKASCFIQGNGSGTWSEYMLAKIDDIIILNDDMNMDQAACFTVNPFTAWGILSIAIAKKARAIIQNASGGQVAAFIRELAHDNNIDVIDLNSLFSETRNIKETPAAHKNCKPDLSSSLFGFIIENALGNFISDW